MKPLKRVLIVDDDGKARDALRHLLSAHPAVKIVGEAADVTAAAALFKELQPDLIFLDVQMPKRDGFSLLPELQPAPDIIFVTAYDHHAVKAFEVNAVDFLVKPIHPERLALALARVGDPVHRKAKPFSEHDPVFLRSDREIRVVLAKEITHVEADQNYAHVHIAGQRPMLIRRSLTEWKRLLPPEGFPRVNRSTIINLYAVKEVLSLPHHRVKIHFLNSGTSVELGCLSARRLRRALRALTSPA
jgi:two-component system LytT family response regulator